MSRLAALLSALLLGLLTATPTLAQFVPNGSLFVATDNPVSFTLLGADQGFNTSLYYSTGSGAFDVDHTASIVTGAATGTTVASPTLSPGTSVFLADVITPAFLQAPLNSGLITTGNPQIKDPFFTVFNGVRVGAPNPFEIFGPHAGVFFQANNTALVGFTRFADSPLPADFSLYPVRFSVSNVFSGGGIGAVPEPSTWLLTLIGLMAAGVMWRRRMR